MANNLEQIDDEVLGLPIEDRIRLARKLWESLPDSERPPSVEADAELLIELRERDGELADGVVTGRTHEEVMNRVRQAIR